MHVQLLDFYLTQQLTKNNDHNIIPFLDFIFRLIVRDPSNNLLFIPEIPDIILGVCLREVIPCAFASGDTTSKAKTLRLCEKFKTVLEALEEDIHTSDLVRLVFPFTLRLLEVRVQVPPSYVTEYTNAS